MKVILNKKARFNYEFLEEYEAGIVLNGREVKSVKGGHLDLSGAYVSITNDEAFLNNAKIPRYIFSAPDESYQSDRKRKLLLKKSEILSLKGKLTQKGLTLVPTKVYTKRHRIKVSVALARGKSRIDKRETIKKRDAERKIQQRLRRKF